MRAFYGVIAISALSYQAHGFELNLNSSDFGVTPVFSSVEEFQFIIDIDGPLQSGVYGNPVINSVSYSIRGSLDSGTPSMFPGFALERTMTGVEFYNQGSSLSFVILASADFSDGLQVSELSGVERVLVFNGREEDTGRYHPALFELNSDGTGRVQNSNNSGGTALNPVTHQLVDVNFGDEYISDLNFDPATTTIAVPEVSVGLMAGWAALGLMVRRRRV